MKTYDITMRFISPPRDEPEVHVAKVEAASPQKALLAVRDLIHERDLSGTPQATLITA